MDSMVQPTRGEIRGSFNYQDQDEGKKIGKFAASYKPDTRIDLRIFLRSVWGTLITGVWRKIFGMNIYCQKQMKILHFIHPAVSSGSLNPHMNAWSGIM